MSNSRVMMEVERMQLPDSVSTMPIPMAANKQFIVAKEKSNLAAELQSRRLFWYKQELLKNMTAIWHLVTLINNQ